MGAIREQRLASNVTKNMNRIATLVFLLACGAADAFTSRAPLAHGSRQRSPSVSKLTGVASSAPPSLTSLAAGPVEVIDPSYNLALGSLALGAAFGVPGSPLKSKLSAFLGGIPLTLFGLFLAFQTTTLRFTLDDDNFSLVRSNGESTGENVVVGGENVWAYKSFVNYDLFPSRSFPILVYFKETQTPEEFWNVGPGEQANSEEALAKGAGEIHVCAEQ